MKKVKIDHFDVGLVRGRFGNRNKSAPRCKSEEEPRCVQTKLEDTEGNPASVSIIMRKPACGTAHPLWLRVSLSVLTVVGDLGLRFSVTLLTHEGLC